MHLVKWTFAIAPGRTKAHLEAVVRDSAADYLGVPGLIRKYYGISEDGGEIVGVYLWESRTAAERFYTREWQEMVSRRWGAAPRREEWECPVSVENREQRLETA